MNFKQLSALAKKEKVKLDGVLDIHSLNKNKKGKYFIYLMEKFPDSGIPGHFVALIKGEHQENYFFDSFGLPPIEEIISFLHVPIKYSTFQIQNIEDKTCGPLCIKLLKEYQKNFDFEKAVLSMGPKERS